MGTADFTIVENVLSLKEIINPKRIEHATQKARWKPEMISIDLFRECQSCVVFLLFCFKSNKSDSTFLQSNSSLKLIRISNPKSLRMVKNG